MKICESDCSSSSPSTMASWHGRLGHDTKLDRFVNCVPTKGTLPLCSSAPLLLRPSAFRPSTPPPLCPFFAALRHFNSGNLFCYYSRP